MTADNLEEKLKKFECQRCNECCRKPGFVYLKEGEAERIAAFLSLEVFDFVNQYCDLQDRCKLVLKKQKMDSRLKHAGMTVEKHSGMTSEACIFLTGAGCSIHPAKPQQCLDFPVKWRTPASFEYCEGLKKIPA